MSHPNSPLLSVQGVELCFGPQRVLTQVDLTVHAGELVALIGPSGCGKSTLLRAIAGLQDPDAGSISFLNRQLFSSNGSIPPEKRAIGLVFQDGAVFPHLSVLDNLTFGLRGLSSSERGTRGKTVARLLGIEELLQRSPHQLSGGQLQRVALGRALAPEPALLLLDEPFAHLDVVLRDQLRRELFDTLRALQIPTLLVTHDRDEAALADRVYLMDSGQIVQTASPLTLRDKPTNSFAATFFAGSSLLSGHVRGATFEAGRWRFPAGNALDDGARQLVVLPDSIEAVAPGDGDLQGFLVRREQRGGLPLALVAESSLTAAEGADDLDRSQPGRSPQCWVLATDSSPSAAGAPVGLQFRRTHFHCF